MIDAKIVPGTAHCPLGFPRATLDTSPVRLVARPATYWRLERIVTVVSAEPPRWAEWLRVSLGWARVPWLKRRIVRTSPDDSFAMTYKRVGFPLPILERPALLLYWWALRRSQITAVKSTEAFVTRIVVRNTTVLSGRFPLETFSPSTLCEDLHAPECTPGDDVEVWLEGRGGPISVVAIGEIRTPICPKLPAPPGP